MATKGFTFLFAQKLTFSKRYFSQKCCGFHLQLNFIQNLPGNKTVDRRHTPSRTVRHESENGTDNAHRPTDARDRSIFLAVSGFARLLRVRHGSNSCTNTLSCPARLYAHQFTSTVSATVPTVKKNNIS